MERKNSICFPGMVMALALTLSVVTVMAGPPLICHPFDIGGARSLPWAGDSARISWNSPAPGYDVRRLAEDTVGLLADGVPVLVRMETIRRAAIYGSGNAAAAEALLAKVRARAESREKSEAKALHLFDFGYMVETMRQTSHRGAVPRSLSGLDGYFVIRKALGMRPGDPEMEFAASIVTLYPKRDKEHREHFRRAVSGTQSSSLLAANLVSHFPDQGRSLSELQARAAVQPAGRNTP
jgi:hypothetical protein